MTATFEASNEAKTQEERPCIHWGNVDIIEFDEYSDEEAEMVWYSENELASIGRDAFQLASHPHLNSSQNRQRGSPEKDQHSMRGLEAMTGRFRSQTSLGKAVLDEQLRQQTMGFRDEGLIALVSRSDSSRHVRRALELGREDQESADEILERVREPRNVVPTTNNNTPKEQNRVRGITKHARMNVGQRMMRFFGQRKV